MKRFDDRGQLAGGEAIPFGILIFVVGALLIANAWAVVDAKFAVDSAAQAAVRTYAETQQTSPSAAEHDARLAGERSFAAYGRKGVAISFPEGSSEQVRRCDRVTALARYTVPAINLPFIGGYGEGFVVTATHSRTVDPLRSGVAGEATCL